MVKKIRVGNLEGNCFLLRENVNAQYGTLHYILHGHGNSRFSGMIKLPLPPKSKLEDFYISSVDLAIFYLYSNTISKKIDSEHSIKIKEFTLKSIELGFNFYTSTLTQEKPKIIKEFKVPMQGLFDDPDKLFKHTINALLKNARLSTKKGKEIEGILALKKLYPKLIKKFPSELQFFKSKALLYKKLRELRKRITANKTSGKPSAFFPGHQTTPNSTSNQSFSNETGINNNFSI